ncbi:MAG TPA: hypothetical protein VGU46_09295 [Acidobacteriaceae bacterium]|nr:hypothetical protein [Acidobacteriaceae bacterium]
MSKRKPPAPLTPAAKEHLLQTALASLVTAREMLARLAADFEGCHWPPEVQR